MPKTNQLSLNKQFSRKAQERFHVKNQNSLSLMKKVNEFSTDSKIWKWNDSRSNSSISTTDLQIGAGITIILSECAEKTSTKFCKKKFRKCYLVSALKTQGAGFRKAHKYL